MAYEAMKTPNGVDRPSEKRMHLGANYKLNDNIDILFKVLMFYVHFLVRQLF